MSDKIVYDFVCCFISEHKSYWDCLSEKDAFLLNNINIGEDELEKIIFAPEENVELVERHREKLGLIELILNHRECAYDFFLYQKIKNNIWQLDYFKKDSFDFIFAEPEKYAAKIKEPKSISAYMKKILTLLPQPYQEKITRERRRLFGEFKCHLDSVSFETQENQTDPIFFSRSQMKLIPYFIEYRSKNLLKCFFDFNSRREYRDFLSNYGKSTFFSDMSLRAKEVGQIFENYCSDKIWELLNLYQLHNPPFSPAQVNYDKCRSCFEIKYAHYDDSQAQSHCVNYRYVLRTEDISSSMIKFQNFLGQTEKKKNDR